jgi:glycine/D-amino acid oxidase-like deaminating enzyme/nitrite reductase/ring-hydroxylating ferredoxin subunit
MSAVEPSARPIWVEENLPGFPRLEADVEVDVVVVGGGITGITTAYLLRKEGVRVALIERERMACADTARTTAHLTFVTDQRLHRLVKQLGKDGARAFWEAGAASIDQIWQNSQDTGADCDFRWVPGYLHEPVHATGREGTGGLDEDAALASEFGLDARLLVAVPCAHERGLRFAHQAKFHPRKYLAALLKAIPGGGSHVFENTAFEEVSEKPFAVRANGHSIYCDYVVLATHNPLMGEKGALASALFQTKLALYTSYALGAQLPRGAVPEALFWDTAEPYDYLRIDEHGDHQYAIYGGADVKTGQEKDPVEVFRTLESRLHSTLPAAKVRNRWLGQVIETPDGLPYIGENGERQFIATGFSGNGMTLGTLGAMMARDRYLSRTNPWSDLFRVDRLPFHGGLWRYARENIDYPYYFLRSRLGGVEEGTVETLGKGEGRLLRWQGHKVAAYRNEQGALSICSPVCTHLKCLVKWNNADRTWDCPCHGSRFHPDGRVLSGPAEEPLERLDQKG